MVILDIPTILPSAAAEEVPDIFDEIVSVELEETDDTGNYSYDDGDGIQVTGFIYFLETIVIEHSGNRGFSFSDSGILDEDLFEEIEDLRLRNHLIDFTNSIYTFWKRNWIEIPDYSSTAHECRDHCDGCATEGAWTTPDYEGVLPEDWEEHADFIRRIDELPDAGERLAARRANALLQARVQREYDVWRDNNPDEFTCEEDCESFLDHVNESVRENTTTDTTALRRAFKTFCDEKGLTISPVLPEPDDDDPEPVIHENVRPYRRHTPPLLSIRTLLRGARHWSS